MEKHPIDKLFGKGLKHHEIEPSAKVWERLQTTSKKSYAHYWIAASIMLVSLAGVLLWNTRIEPAESTVVVKKENRKFLDKEINEGREENEKLVVSKVEIPPVSEHTVIRQEVKQAKVVVQDEERPFRPDVLVKEAIVQNNQEELLVITEENPLPAILNIADQPIEQLVENRLKESNTSKNSSRVLIVAIQESSLEEMAVPTKEKRVRKIFKQLKQLKNGEEVNWQEVGVNPKELLARVDPLKSNKKEY